MNVLPNVLVLLAAAVHGFHLQGPSGPLVAQLGGSVLLPCSAETPLPLEELEVQWKRTDSESLVHLFQEGEERPESQDYAYSGRAHFTPDKIVKGDFSLLLENITANDRGVYRCVVYTALESSESTCEIENVEYLVVHGAHHGVFAYAGEEAVLDCSVESHIPPEQLEEIKWKKIDQEILVLLYQDGVILADSSHDQYRGRAEFFTTEIYKGNFSLRLRNLRTEDKGEYICEAHSGLLIGNTIVELLSLGLAVEHQMILALCIIAFGLSISSLIHFIKTERGRGTMLVHFSLVFITNILLFVAFILWGCIEGFLDEAATCATVNLARIIFLLLISSYLDDVYFPECLLNTIRLLSILLQYSVISTVLYSVAFRNRHKLNILAQTVVPRMELSIYFGLITVSCACGIIAVSTRAICPSLYCIHGSGIETRPKEIWSFIFMEISNLAQMLFISYNTRTFDPVVRMVLLIYLVIQPLSLILIRKLRKKMRRGNVCWTVTMALLGPVYVASDLYCLSQVQDGAEKIFPTERAGIVAVTTLLKILSALSLLEHPSNLHEIPHLIVYGFGAVVVCIVNSIVLMAELLSKARNGKRLVSDMRFVVLPFECIFVSGWFYLLIHNYWTCSTNSSLRGNNGSDINNDVQQQDTPAAEETEMLPPC